MREAGLFGAFGGHVNVTDGRYVYMRACAEPANEPLYEYTLMPTHMRGRFAPQELIHIDLADPFVFTKGVRVLRIPGKSFGGAQKFGSMLFDLASDPGQEIADHRRRRRAADDRVAAALDARDRCARRAI